MTNGPRWLPDPAPTGAVLVSASQRIRDEAARVAAAAGLELATSATLADAFALRPSVVLAGSDIGESRTPANGELILVGLPGDDEAVWAAASRLRASRVAILPAAAGWLAERFASLRASGPPGHFLGVLGGSGGAGASSLCCWLALNAARSGRATLLMDGDCSGGGLHLALGPDSPAGVRWEDLGEVSGTLNPDQLAGALPMIGGFAVLSTSGSGATDCSIMASAVVPSVVDAARRAFTLTIVDLPCGWPWGGPLLPLCDEVILLVPGRRRPLAAASSLAEQVPSLPLSVVVRGPLAAGLDTHRVADLVGRPLGGYLPHLRGVPDAERQGRLLEFGGHHRAIRRLTTAVLSTLPSGTGGGGP